MPFVPDPDFLEGCIHRVTVYLDANRAGGVTDDHGGVPHDWQPVAGQESVACRVVPDRDDQTDNDSKPGAAVRYKILLPAPQGWDQNTRADFTDAQGVVHELLVRGQPREPHHMQIFWVAKAVEYVG